MNERISKNTSITNPVIKKIISVITLLAFSFNTIVWDMDISGSCAWGEAIPPAIAKTGITIPEELGKIVDSVSAAPKGARRGKEVIYIQDAHCNNPCQKSIGGIMEYLSREYGVDLALLEGGAGTYDLSMFTDIKDKAVLEKVAGHFMKEGKINGSEYFAVNSPGKMSLMGLERPDLYFKDLEVYRDSLSYRDEATGCLDMLDERLTALKEKIYSKELAEFDQKKKDYGEGKTGLGEYLLYLAGVFVSGVEDIPKSGDLGKILGTIASEKKIDFARANEERDELIEVLGKRLSGMEIATLTVESEKRAKGTLSESKFYSYLLKKAASAGVDVAKSYPELFEYERYIATYGTIDKTRLLTEVEKLEGR
ncbi:MAG: hypothetical protein HQL30_12535, partial [Candidatus Omnitrophica bacterium]|nr:hypothetical protein [Candidatus Omnitrophota bacterium]